MISKDNWRKYIDRLAAIDKRAADQMQEWIDIHGLADTDALIEYAYGLVSKYGEASATLSCDMYDYMADLMDADVPEAIPAETATINEVARGVTWGKYHSPSQIPSVVSRQVRQAGADTMIQNAKRDNAEWAWVPQGDTCAFCITLASRGWQEASKTVLRGNHAEHIHQNCDCTFAIAFKPSDKKQYDAVYDPQEYKDMYYSAEGSTPDEKINSIRRIIYAEGKSDKVVFGSTEFLKRRIPPTMEHALNAANPNRLLGSEYQKNCQRCVVAYEMRRQGYIVEAKPAMLGPDNDISPNDPTIKDNRWMHAFKGVKWSKQGATKDEIRLSMEEWGDGARTEIYIAWQENGTYKAHTFIAEMVNGRIRFLDPQTNDLNCERYFTTADPKYTMYARIDGLVPVDNIGIFVKDAKRKQ